MIKNFRHVGIRVANLKTELKFFGLLGFKKIYDEIEKWNEFGNIHIIKLKSKNDIIIELIKYPNYGLMISNSHLCFEVYNLDRLYKKLKKNKIAFLAEPKRSPDDSVYIAFCYSPNNILIELVEVTENK